MINKLPFTVFFNEHINAIKELEVLGVYSYLVSLFQNSGITFTKKQVLELISDHFNSSEKKAEKYLNYLLTLKLGEFNNYIA